MVTEIIGELEGKGKALNQYSKFNDLPLEYDTNGNLSAKGSRLFAYDYQNRLIRSSRGDDAVTFTYDIFGRQTNRTDLSGTCHFFYAGDQKIEERNASGQVTKHYVWGNGIDELLRLDIYNGSSSTPYYIHTDAIGSTTAITDESGNLVERVTYDVYGVPTFTDALGQTLKKSAIRNTTLFQGREYDYDLALYNYRARYFDPSLGRFLQTDPLGYQDSMNLYQGMGMNPVNFVDPWGEKFVFQNKASEKMYVDLVKAMNDLLKKQPEKQELLSFKNIISELDASEVLFQIRNPRLLASSGTESEKRALEAKGGVTEPVEIEYEGKKTLGIGVSVFAGHKFWSENARLSHEIVHAYQFLIGKIGFQKNIESSKWLSYKYDIYDEVEAFKMQKIFASDRDNKQMNKLLLKIVGREDLEIANILRSEIQYYAGIFKNIWSAPKNTAGLTIDGGKGSLIYKIINGISYYYISPAEEIGD